MLDRRCLFLLILFSANLAQAGQPAPKPQELFASYWTSEPGWDTELQLKNNLASGSLTVTPVLRLLSAQEIPLDPVTIAANDSISVWVNMGLLKHSPDLLSQPGSYGSVVFRFTALDARNAFASSIARLRGGPIEFDNEAHPLADFAAWPRAAGPGSQEGIWSQLRSSGNDFVIVSNSSGKALTAKLWLSDASGKRWSRTINLAAYQTQRLDFHDLLRASGLGGAYGGIRVEVPAYAGALHSLHLLYDEAGQTSQLLKMVARDPATTLAERIPQSDHRLWTTWAPMLPLQVPDPILTMPAGTVLNPTVLVRNTTPKVVPATLSIAWHGERGVADGAAKVQDMRLAPYETRQIQIGPLQKQLGIPETSQWATLKLTSPGLPDDLMAIASSYDPSGRYGTEVTFGDKIGSHFAGGEWRADATHGAIIAVTNAGSLSAQARVTLHYDKGGKKYEVQRTLKTGEQMWLRLAELIQNQIPDRNGNALPPSLSSGTYEVQDIGGKPGSLLVSGLSTDNTFGGHIGHPVPECCNTSNPQFQPGFFEVDLDGMWDPFLTLATDACAGGQVPLDMLSFWPSNPAIAQITSQGVKGLLVGTTTGNGESDLVWVGQGSNCILRNLTPTAPITVKNVTVNNVAPSPLVIGTSGPMGIGGSGFSNLQSPITVSLSGTGVTVTGASVDGDTLINASYTVAAGTAAGSQNLTVSGAGTDGGQGLVSNSFPVTISATAPIPTSATITSNNHQTYASQTWTSCDGTQSLNNVSGYQNCVTYQVNDQHAKPLYQNLTISETVAVVDQNYVSKQHNGNTVTNPTGQFEDSLALVGNPGPPTNACSIIKQSLVANGNPSAIRVNCIRYGPTSVSITDVTSNPSSCSKPTYQCN
jgi:hypothetical protein